MNRNRYPDGLKEAFLQDLAFTYLSQRGHNLSAIWALEQAETFLTRRNRAQVNADDFLHEILRCGILGKFPTGELYFAHKTFLEALAASRFRNKPEELMDLWEAAPDTWLEVCSLYVSDSLTPVGDITVVLNRVLKREAWLTAIILAGEAHTSSGELHASLVRLLRTNRGVWSALDKRAMAALARFGNEARPLLTEFMSEPTVDLRRLAVYGLGQCKEEWATDLLISALTDPLTQKSAAEALAGLGEDAVVLIEDLLRTRSGNSQLARACSEIAGIIGTVGALRAIMPLLWSEVAFDAAGQIVRLLWLPEVRNSLESGELALSKSPATPQEDFGGCAFPWLPDTAANIRSCYAQLSHVLTAAARLKDGDLVLDTLPPDFLIPVLIALGKNGRFATIQACASRSFSSDAKSAPRQASWISTVPELSKRTDDKNRNLWSRVTTEDKKDIVLGSPVARVVWMIGTIGLIAIMIAGARNHVMSWWSLFIPGLWLALLSYLAYDHRGVDPLSYFGAPAAALSIAQSSWSLLNPDSQRVLVFVALGQFYLVFCAAISTLRMGGSWVAFACVLIPGVLRTERSDSLDTEIVLYRRSNPLCRLRNAFQSVLDQSQGYR